MSQVRTHEVTGWVGWIAFAAGMLLLGGVFQLIIGLTAIFNQQWFVASQQGVLVLNIATWGWVHMLLGLVMAVTGISLFSGSVGARAIAAVLAGLSAIANLAFLSAYPLWSMVVIAVDVLIIYALTVHGAEMKEI
jgi:uncharacterized membrane protein